MDSNEITNSIISKVDHVVFSIILNVINFLSSIIFLIIILITLILINFEITITILSLILISYALIVVLVRKNFIIIANNIQKYNIYIKIVKRSI